MPRYYIDIRSHFATSEDPDGIELPDIAAATAEALRVGAKLLETCAGLTPSYSSAIVIEVVDEHFHPVLVIPYTDVAVQRLVRT
jgi:hypothetical protein